MTNKMRVLVLGATGYVGRHIVQTLAATDWAEPIAASRHGAVALDATDTTALIPALQRADAIVNAMAASPQDMIANAQALRAALASKPMRLVHFSSMAAYGNVEGSIGEDQPLLGDLGPYSAAKAQTEHILRDCAETVTLRPGCVYGDGSPQWSARIARLLRAHRIGDLGAAGDGCSNLVHVDDVARAVLAALQRPQAGGQAYNLSMTQAPTWNEYFIAYARALGATPVSRIGARQLKLEAKVLAPALKIAEIAGRRIGLARSLPPPISPSLLRLWRQDIRLSSAKAGRDLGLQWTPWLDALRRDQ
ncbi:MAG TPA: NAD-dependent epimerase/dehydratase family protein [Bordetella sp.]|uniref:NAD-dependent epimerase/dehydratase family protein n=1 Tax=Bordetella sp. TaxID=28081 RepID=UPI002ED43AF7